MLDENLSLEEIAKIVTQDEEVKIVEENIIPVYECNCNKEKFERGIISLGKEELQNIIKEQEEIETICHFCNKKYPVSKEELEKLMQED